jgi:hypothetical protein
MRNYLTPMDELPAEQDPAMEAPIAPVDQGPSDADRLYGAEVAGNKQRMYADLLRSFQTVLQAGAPTSGFKADPSLANSIEKRANQPMEMVKMQMAAEAAKRKETRETEKFGMDKESHKLDVQKKSYEIDNIIADSQQKEKTRDPASQISGFARGLVKDTQVKLGKPVNDAQLDAMSAEEMYKVFPYLQDQLTAMMKQKNEELDRQAKVASQDKDIASREKISQMGAEAKKGPSFEEKEEIKQNIKENVQIKKENRKERSQLQKDYQTWDALEQQIDDAIAKTQKYNKGIGPGTGVVAKAKSMLGSLAPEAQSLDTSLQKLSMDQLVKQFSGMSKAIDTPTERAAFEATVPTIKMDDELLIDELQKRKAAAQAAKERIQTGINRYDKTGEFTQEAKTELSPQDKEALNWANSNPNDPRATEIKRRLGQ